MHSSAMPPLRSRSFSERIDAPEVVRVPGTHLGLTWRALEAQDLPAVVDLMESSHDSPLGILPVSPRTVQLWFDEFLSQSQSSDLLSGWDGQNKLQAVAWVRVNVKPLSELQAEVSAVVRPEWVGRGIGRSLLEWQDDRARQLLAHYPSELPVSIRALSCENNTGRRRLLAAGGYSPISYISHVSTPTHSLHVELSKRARARLAEQGFSLIPYTPEVNTELRRLHNRLILALERYQPLSGSAWQAKLMRADQVFSSLLIKENQLVGYTLAERVPETSTLRIYYYGIEQNLRHQGVGTDLILSVLGPAYEENIKFVGAPVVSRSGKIPASLLNYGFTLAMREIVYSMDIS
ncbi:GNAT family N-acetyltransferase [Arcanobacterium phocisimile]|uniref:GNAT family N-acetyltransferase n=1 Tax=Arcanobacterium phocisimile TaxID=1302235 RepID=A0ABX7IID7_9ACTO|nr:GNAT family N-acetyltransferase [Arcanobacterium phocisimile]QRV02872.1 GNAT family N-acetyltransferase [Arcanobacterium phocisimile]